jgi:hypothetical protein
MRIETVESFLASKVNPHRWRLSGSFLAHLFEATTQQHHRALAATVMRLVPPLPACSMSGRMLGQCRGSANGARREFRARHVDPAGQKSRRPWFRLAHLGTLGNRWDAIAQELVALTTLDAVVAVRGLDRLDFIKADIEGGNCVRCMAVRTPCDGLGRA